MSAARQNPGPPSADRTGAPPVIVLESALAETLLPGQDAIGKCITLAASLISAIRASRVDPTTALRAE